MPERCHKEVHWSHVKHFNVNSLHSVKHQQLPRLAYETQSTQHHLLTLFTLLTPPGIFILDNCKSRIT